jgi:hypothetical protein
MLRACIGVTFQPYFHTRFVHSVLNPSRLEKYTFEPREAATLVLTLDKAYTEQMPIKALKINHPPSAARHSIQTQKCY